MTFQSFRALSVLALGLSAASFSGCSVSGGGKLPSAIDPSDPAGMTFSVNFEIDDSTETISGSANIHDHGGNVNAKVTFSEETFFECAQIISLQEINEFLIFAIEECLDLDEGDINEDDVAIAIGHYRLRGKSKKAALADGLAAEGCFIGLYVDLGEPGTEGDGLAVALVDLNDTNSIYYANCGALGAGNLTVDLLFD